MKIVSDGMERHFEKLIKPLATNKSLEEIFIKLKDDIVKNFMKKIIEQKAEMEKLDYIKYINQIRLYKLIISIHENTIDQLLKSDDNETCSRRNCLVILGVKFKEYENEYGAINTLKEFYSLLDAKDIDCAGNIGLPFTEKNQAKKRNL